MNMECQITGHVVPNIIEIVDQNAMSFAIPALVFAIPSFCCQHLLPIYLGPIISHIMPGPLGTCNRIRL